MQGPLGTKPVYFTAVLMFLAACVSPTPYQEADKRGRGYTDQKLEESKYRITFEGNAQTDLAVVENYILYRAAEIALANDADHFIVLDQNTEELSSFRTTGTSFGGGRFGRHGFFYGSGFGGGLSSATTREHLSYTVGTIIEIRPGDKPADNPDAYDARQLIQNLQPALVLPKEE